MKRAAPAFWFLAGLLTALILPHAKAGTLDDFSGVYATDSVITTATARLPYQSVMTFRVRPSGRAGSLSTTGFVNANGTTFNLRNQFQINGGRFAVQTIAPPSNYSPADGIVDFNRRRIQGRATALYDPDWVGLFTAHLHLSKTRATLTVTYSVYDNGVFVSRITSRGTRKVR